MNTLPRHKMTDGFVKEERCHICSFMMTSVVRLSLSKRKARQHIRYEIQLISKIQNRCVRGNVVYWLQKVITLKFSKGRDQGFFSFAIFLLRVIHSFSLALRRGCGWLGRGQVIPVPAFSSHRSSVF